MRISKGLVFTLTVVIALSLISVCTPVQRRVNEWRELIECSVVPVTPGYK